MINDLLIKVLMILLGGIAISVLCSRAGLWMFDLTARQIAQVTIKETVRGRVNGQWKAIISFFDINSKYFDISYNKIFKYFFINNNLNSLKYNIRDSFIKYKYLNNFNKKDKQVLLKKKLLDNNLKLNAEKKK
jgi:hypothetical protein